MFLRHAARIGAGTVIVGLLAAITPSADAAGPVKLDVVCGNGGGLSGGDCAVVAQAPATPAGPAAGPSNTNTAGGGATSDAVYIRPTDVTVGTMTIPVAGLDQATGGNGINFAGGSNTALCGLGVTAACPAPPTAPGAPPAPNPAQVAQIVISQMKLQPVGIGIVPEDKPGKIGVVGMPAWMWVANPGEATTGPMTRSATAGPVTVTAVATLDRVEWNMGDGTTPVVCHGAGIAYSAGWDAADSPTCGHRYQKTSENQPGMAYTVTATSHWTITWAGGGAAGVVAQQVTANTRIQVGEFQVIVTHS